MKGRYPSQLDDRTESVAEDLHLYCSVSDPPLQVEDPSSQDADYANKAAAFEWSRQTISDECSVPRYSEFTAARSPIFSCVPRISRTLTGYEYRWLYSASSGDQPTLYIGAERDGRKYK